MFYHIKIACYQSLLDTGTSINILPKSVFDCHHVGEL